MKMSKPNSLKQVSDALPPGTCIDADIDIVDTIYCLYLPVSLAQDILSASQHGLYTHLDNR